MLILEVVGLSLIFGSIGGYYLARKCDRTWPRSFYDPEKDWWGNFRVGFYLWGGGTLIVSCFIINTALK